MVPPVLGNTRPHRVLDDIAVSTPQQVEERHISIPDGTWPDQLADGLGERG